MTSAAIPPRIHVWAKPTGAIGNLNCSYCFFLNKERLYPGSHFRMSDEVLETYIRIGISIDGPRHLHTAPVLPGLPGLVRLQGGMPQEPLSHHPGGGAWTELSVRRL